MKLKKIIKHIQNIEVKGSKDIEVTGITSNSKTVVPGNLFIAKKGITCDGSQFIDEAIEAGASAILTDMYNPFLAKNVVQLISKNISFLEGEIANVFYDDPSKSLFTVGVTGTSGKTTTTYMIRYLCEKLIGNTGLIGTVEWIVGNQYFPSTMTTPDIITNLKLMRDMRDSGSQACVMEVSSHALVQRRVDTIDFDVAVFTNLSRDHLDYHKDMEDYASAKARLFYLLKDDSKTAVLNADSEWTPVVAKDIRAKKITYGITNLADVTAQDILLSGQGTKFTVCYKEEKLSFSSPLIGLFNVYNLLAAISVGLSKNFSLGKVVEVLSSFHEVPGRLQRVANSRGLDIFVDYSHKPDALENVLKTLNHIKKNKLICLFGCGGDRDQGKRSIMGEIGDKFSDELIITSDNPRSEDPLEIINQILSGVQDLSKVIVEPDRKLAINLAVKKMSKGDILLIAGKGHETYQIFSNSKVKFDDRMIAQESCK
ncbi:MAG: UDP-N-acetylmuramoyl-L-alanyl-D-glutamate--2,6-diaminopimelate ligase [Chlamydiae bacterium]|nr:UDP-N-acetylmuramoyl-L-alanyl-D-glutamate--2,6-diaminopimelate ligase [Chlamydiota bacterium]